MSACNYLPLRCYWSRPRCHLRQGHSYRKHVVMVILTEESDQWIRVRHYSLYDSALNWFKCSCLKNPVYNKLSVLNSCVKLLNIFYNNHFWVWFDHLLWLYVIAMTCTYFLALTPLWPFDNVYIIMYITRV